MEIKSAKQSPARPINISEWNDETQAFFKPLTTTERLIFQDLYREYLDRESTPLERARAGARAAVLTLIDAAGQALLTDADVPKLAEASYAPISRVFLLGLDPDAEDSSFKKN